MYEGRATQDAVAEVTEKKERTASLSLWERARVRERIKQGN
jgi:hypothetical protein